MCSYLQNVKPSDVVLDAQGRSFEGALFLNDWVYSMNVGKKMIPLYGDVSD